MGRDEGHGGGVGVAMVVSWWQLLNAMAWRGGGNDGDGDRSC